MVNKIYPEVIMHQILLSQYLNNAFRESLQRFLSSCQQCNTALGVQKNAITADIKCLLYLPFIQSKRNNANEGDFS